MKEIQLTQGKVTIVDDDDYEFLNSFKWFAVKDKNNYYARRSIRVGEYRKNIGMHSFLIGKSGVDHIDNDSLNNQRSNLRECNNQQNCMNKRSHINTSSQYKGVSYRKCNGRFLSQIQKDGRKLHIGVYDTEELAAIAYNKMALELFGEFAQINKLENK